MVGKGKQEDEFRSLATSLSIDAQVHFAGWVDHDELESYYQDSQIVTVPSRWPEPFGMVGIEGMIRARPVVGFAVGGINDWLVDGKTGLLAEPGDIEDFARCLDRLLSDYELSQQFGQQAACHVKKNYKHRNFVGTMAKLVEELV
jgi:glycosyltransferase involved in cell wall biosynthesis